MPPTFVRLLAVVGMLLWGDLLHAEERPNILWLTTEDIGPHLGCYGDPDARTPHLDRFAEKSIQYLNAWSNAPVCAPARTTLISGMYPPSTGSEHMRSRVRLPSQFHMYPVYLREAGYFCINPGKEDYNLLKEGKVWETAPKQNPWPELKRRQPFMAVFNNTKTHESQIRTRPHEWKHDPAQVTVPPYHPDAKEVREDWAQYHDNISEMDEWFGQQIEMLEQNGLAENTIVFFYGDHGSGMPRNKRWLYNSGLRVPLLIHVPERFQHLLPQGTVSKGPSKQLVSFVDFVPTILSLAGKQPPEHLQGHAFLGPFAEPPQKYLFGFRGRMDERIDMSRTVRNHRYHYIRNYYPHRTQGEYLEYMFETPTTRKWKELYEAGKLNDAQKAFWEPKPPEELYDMEADPHEIHNLVNSPDHAEILQELQQALIGHLLEIRDVGFLPEDELHHHRCVSPRTPYDVGHDLALYPIGEVLRMANLATGSSGEVRHLLIDGLKHTDSAVRYWAVIGLLIRGETEVPATRKSLREMLENDDSPSVRTVVAEALGKYGSPEDLEASLQWLIDAANMDTHGPYLAVLALNSIDHLGEKNRPIVEQVAALPKTTNAVPTLKWNYTERMITKITGDLK